MRYLALALAITALSASPVEAHHKPGHHIPPGQAKKLTVEAAPPEALVRAVLSEDFGWRRYSDEMYYFEIELPLGLFELTNESSRGLHFREMSGLSEIQVYGADNPQGLPPRAFVTALEDVERIDEVTYRAEGQSWFVLSGYYADDEGLGEPIIFYTKFMFSSDRTRVSAFEMSYPASEKRRFDGIVTRIEKSLTAPR